MRLRLLCLDNHTNPWHEIYEITNILGKSLGKGRLDTLLATLGRGSYVQRKTCFVNEAQIASLQSIFNEMCSCESVLR